MFRVTIFKTVVSEILFVIFMRTDFQKQVHPINILVINFINQSCPGSDTHGQLDSVQGFCGNYLQ